MGRVELVAPIAMAITETRRATAAEVIEMQVLDIETPARTRRKMRAATISGAMELTHLEKVVIATAVDTSPGHTPHEMAAIEIAVHISPERAVIEIAAHIQHEMAAIEIAVHISPERAVIE